MDFPTKKAIKKLDFRNKQSLYEAPTVIVADYIFGDEHEDSSVGWVFRKLDRFENDSSYTSDAWSSSHEVKDTVTSKYVPLVKETKLESNACNGKQVPKNKLTLGVLKPYEISSIMRRLKRDSTFSSSSKQSPKD